MLQGAIAWVQVAVIGGAPLSMQSVAAAVGLVCLMLPGEARDDTSTRHIRRSENLDKNLDQP